MSAKLLLGFIFCLSAPAALAVERGTAGLVEAPFTARNGASSDISCSVSIAHWYSAELGQAAPGGTIHRSFWSDPASGTLYLLNGTGDRMPVQLTWCGLAGRNWETRSVLILARDRATDVTCVSAENRLTCR
jgi:hypothetical protein